MPACALRQYTSGANAASLALAGHWNIGGVWKEGWSTTPRAAVTHAQIGRVDNMMLICFNGIGSSQCDRL
jgi:hypothetical protein